MNRDDYALAQDFHNLELDNGFGGAVDFLAEVPPRNESVTTRLPEDIFSKMIYENICPGEDLLYSSNAQSADDCGRPP